MKLGASSSWHLALGQSKLRAYDLTRRHALPAQCQMPTANVRPTERFSQRVENYVKYRPGYPPELLDCLREHCGLAPEWIVADIGCGTGLLAELFLKNGNRVFGIEPNGEMRTAGETFLKKYEAFTSIAAPAESTTLASNSVDLIVAGQAFHWFDRARARREFERILKSGGWVALIWNERLTNTPFLAAYEDMLHRYAPEYENVDHRHINDEVIAEFFGSAAFQKFVLPNHQDFDYTGLVGRLLSSSFVPLKGQPGHDELLARNEQIFREYASDGRVRFEYETKVYCGHFTQ